MPAHLESTDRAMRAEQASKGNDRQARMEDQDKDRNTITPVAAPSASPRQRWRARMDAAVILKQKKKTLENELRSSDK